MKKSTLLIAALALGTSMAFAQDLTSKKGENYLPEEGEYAIGIDAVPYINYFGNMMNGNTSNSPFNWGFTNVNTMITGKMFTSSTSAYRVALRIGFGSGKSTAEIMDATATAPTFPALPTMKEDVMKSSSRFIGLGGGMEWRRGSTRLQGYWGGMVMFWMSGSKQTYEYGNALTTTTVISSANSTDWGTGNLNNSNATWGNNRVMTEKQGSTLGFGLRGFAGAEYFVLPKISIGGEFGWGFGFTSTGRGEITYDAVNGAPASVGTGITEETGAKSSGMGFDTDNNNFGLGASGSLLIHFHF